MSDSQTFEFVAQGNRLNDIRLYLKLTQKELAQIFEAGQGNFSTVISGRRKIPKSWYLHLEKKYPQLDTNWLKTGEGEMLKSSDEASREMITSSIKSEYGNGRELTSTEMERMMTRLTYELTAIRENLEAMEMWKEQMTKHMGRVLGYLNEIDELKKGGKWPK